jgi:hypothetical protein
MDLNIKENTTYCDYMISKNGGLPLRHHARRNRYILVMNPEPNKKRQLISGEHPKVWAALIHRLAKG